MSTASIAATPAPAPADPVQYAMLLELPHFLMQRRMLLEVKRRAEMRP